MKIETKKDIAEFLTSWFGYPIGKSEALIFKSYYSNYIGLYLNSFLFLNYSLYLKYNYSFIINNFN